MTIQKATYIFLSMILAFVVLVLSSQHSRWLILNGIAATELSNNILNQEAPKTPDWAIDLVIISSIKGQTVKFSEHHSEFTYVYSPVKEPVSSRFNWQHLIGAWYVGKIKT